MREDELAILEIGMRVKMSALGIEQLKPRRGTSITGAIAGFSRYYDCIVVRRDNVKTAQVYHRVFWDLAGDGTA